MVIYETRYENDQGKLGSTKQMFFEIKCSRWQAHPRFKEIPLNNTTTTDVTESDINIIALLIEKSLGEWDPKRFYSTFNQHQKFHLATAYIEDQPVGFKIGYERTQHEFYNNLVGSATDIGGLGIAGRPGGGSAQLVTRTGFFKISTKNTKSISKAMLILNIKNGFKIIGTEPTDKDGIKILMEKKL
ncbi:MAG: hypothetical protein IPK04_18810 [Bdellovibrionales bacterium]|nr:hypothetical protein [Bdellovibrionales bacterium]